MNQVEFIKEITQLEIVLDQSQQKQLEKFYQLLVEWNQKMNLTRIIEKESVYLKHFYDSLTLVKVIDFNKIKTLCDVGSGAGFPGIVLKIAFPHLKIVLLDSLLKRVNYLNEIIKELELKDIIPVHTRAEDYSKQNNDSFEIVTARAVTNLKSLSEICLSLVQINGYFISMKASADEEIEEATPIIKNLGGNIEKIEKFILPLENSQRTLIKIKKTHKVSTKINIKKKNKS